MYKEYAETARQEGLDNIADLFERVGAIEKITKAASTHLLKCSLTEAYVLLQAKQCGSAATADISTAALPLRNTVLSAADRRVIFSERKTAGYRSL